MLYVLVGYGLVVAGALMILGAIGLRFKGTLTQHALPPNPPSVSTIVPARNEERNIDRCARGIVSQDYPNLEMIFVDDDSKDRTGEILAGYAARDSRLKAINTGGKPEGWNGKQWACHSGAMKATGEWLCFMDADTFAEPQLLSRTVAFAVAKGIDMLTLQPWYEMRGLWERIVLPFLPWLLFVFPPGRVNDPNNKLSMANGQFILIRRSVYDAVGGHEAVRTRMMDDFSLAEIVKGAGHRLYVVDGMEVMRVRLYTNLKEIRGGAIKAAVELSGGWFTSIIVLLANLLINVVPVILLSVYMLLGNMQAALISGAIVLFQVLYYGAIRMLGFRLPPWTAVTYPLGAILVSIILFDGMIRVATGGEIKWKDRDVMGAPQLPGPVSLTQGDGEA